MSKILIIIMWFPFFLWQNKEDDIRLVLFLGWRLMHDIWQMYETEKSIIDNIWKYYRGKKSINFPQMRKTSLLPGLGPSRSNRCAASCSKYCLKFCAHIFLVAKKQRKLRNPIPDVFGWVLTKCLTQLLSLMYQLSNCFAFVYWSNWYEEISRVGQSTT